MNGQKIRQAEGLCHMMYYCEKCGKIERIWNSRPRVTPFMIGCSECDGTMQHVDFQSDEFDPNYQPKEGERVFIDLPKEFAKIKYQQQIDDNWESKQYPISEMFKTKEQALESFMKQWQFGTPMIENL